jgi:hypothetical protein
MRCWMPRSWAKSPGVRSNPRSRTRISRRLWMLVSFCVNIDRACGLHGICNLGLMVQLGSFATLCWLWVDAAHCLRDARWCYSSPMYVTVYVTEMLGCYVYATAVACKFSVVNK